MPHDDDDDGRGSFGGGFTGGSFGDSTESDDIGGGGDDSGGDSGGGAGGGDDDPGGASSGGGGFGRAPSNPVADTPSGGGGGGGGGDDDDDDDDGGRNPSGGPSPGAGGDPADDNPATGTDEPSGRTPGGGPSPGAGGDPRDDDPSVGGDPTDDDPSPGEPGGTPPGFGDDNDTDSGPSQQEQRQNQIDDAVSDFVSSNPFAQAAGDVAASFQSGSVETELTDAAAEAQQQAQDIIANNPAADAVADLSIGDTVSVRDQVQRSFERQQAVSQTVSESPFADEPDDVDVTFDDGQAQTDLAGDAARAQQRTNRLLASNPAAESLSDIAIGDGDASVTEDAQRDFEREQTVEQTIEQSPFADEPDDVDVEFSGGDGSAEPEAEAELAGDAAQEREAVEQTVASSPFADEPDDVETQIQGGAVETELTGDAVAAQQQAQELLSNDPAADTLGDLDIGDGSASVGTEAERQFQSQQRDRLRDLVFSQPDSASVAPIDDPPAREPESETTATETQQGLATDAAAARANRQIAGVRETQAEQAGADQSEQQQQQQAETRASVSRFGQQQLDAQRSTEVFGDVAIENPVTGNRVEDDLQTAADEFQESGEFALANLGRVQPTPVTTGVGGARTADEVDDGVRGAAAESFIETINPPAVAAETKEAAEFLTQRGDEIGQEVLEPQADLLAGNEIDTSTELQRDVAARGSLVAEAAAENPAETTASVIGGIAGGIGGGLAASRGIRGAVRGVDADTVADAAIRGQRQSGTNVLTPDGRGPLDGFDGRQRFRQRREPGRDLPDEQEQIEKTEQIERGAEQDQERDVVGEDALDELARRQGVDESVSDLEQTARQRLPPRRAFDSDAEFQRELERAIRQEEQRRREIQTETETETETETDAQTQTQRQRAQQAAAAVGGAGVGQTALEVEPEPAIPNADITQPTETETETRQQADAVTGAGVLLGAQQQAAAGTQQQGGVQQSQQQSVTGGQFDGVQTTGIQTQLGVQQGISVGVQEEIGAEIQQGIAQEQQLEQQLETETETESELRTELEGARPERQRIELDPGDDQPLEEDRVVDESAIDDLFDSGIEDAEDVLGTDGASTDTVRSLEDSLGL